MQDRRPGKVSEQKSWGILRQSVTSVALSNSGDNSIAYAISVGKLHAFNDLCSNAEAGAKQKMYGRQKVKIFD